MKFLIDECLSPDLVTIAREAGHEAYHLVHIGKAGWKDWNVIRHAYEGDFVIVTNNGDDFRRLYATEPLHAGLVILIPNVERPTQQHLFQSSLIQLAVRGELINHVLEIDLDGEGVKFTIYELPPAT